MKKSSIKTADIVQIALLGAIIVVLSTTPLGYVPLGFTRATTLHIPVIIGSILLGPKKGSILGALFGLTSLLSNTMNPTITSFVFTPFSSFGATSGNVLSLVICFVPRILVGIVPYFVFKGIRNISRNEKSLDNKPKDFAALICAGLAGSLTNTLLVMNMIYLFFGKSYAGAKEIEFSSLYGVILSVIGINGVPEAIVAAILTLAIGKILLKPMNYKQTLK